jgi:membrane protein YdbS with pleckstrin-like domain
VSTGDRAAQWIYGGLWRWVVAWFHVPEGPPLLPTSDPESLLRFHPALAYLRYLKLWFWLALAVVDLAIAALWIAIALASPPVGMLLLGPALVVAAAPDIVVYIALHLRYDTTWYVISNRSLRIRKGIWVLREMTVTFENVQNIGVTQGPVMRLFGIKNLVVETAGAAVSKSAEEGGRGENQAVLEGLGNADEIRDLILARVRASRSAGLGDEAATASGGETERAPPRWAEKQIRLLREIRDEAALLAS